MAQVFGVKTKIWFILVYFFNVYNMEVLMMFQLSAQTTCLGNIWLLIYGLKTFRPIKMQDY